MGGDNKSLNGWWGSYNIFSCVLGLMVVGWEGVIMGYRVIGAGRNGSDDCLKSVIGLKYLR